MRRNRAATMAVLIGISPLRTRSDEGPYLFGSTCLLRQPRNPTLIATGEP
jgi:hypothetical protein